jgi:hypothetical protein
MEGPSPFTGQARAIPGGQWRADGLRRRCGRSHLAEFALAARSLVSSSARGVVAQVESIVAYTPIDDRCGVLPEPPAAAEVFSGEPPVAGAVRWSIHPADADSRRPAPSSSATTGPAPSSPSPRPPERRD